MGLNKEQLHAAAVNLLTAIKNNENGAYDEWMNISKNKTEVALHADWVRRAADLQHTPSEDDLDAMCDYAKEHLQKEVAEMKKVRPNAVGAYCAVED